MNKQVALDPTQQAFVISQMRYARKLALKFYRERERGDLDLEDYISAAYLGLCDAARRYDPSRGHSFQNFSHFRIRGAMVDMLRSIGSLPRRCFMKLAEVEGLEVSEEQPGDGEEQAESQAEMKRSGVEGLPYLNSVTELTAVLNAIPGLPIRLHPPVTDEEVQISYSVEISPEEEVIDADTKEKIRGLILALPVKERAVVVQHYFGELSFSSMTDLQSGHTKSWLSRLHHRGLDRIRETIISNPEMADLFAA